MSDEKKATAKVEPIEKKREAWEHVPARIEQFDEEKEDGSLGRKTRATCLRCNHIVTAWGTRQPSMDFCFGELRRSCPLKQKNFYEQTKTPDSTEHHDLPKNFRLFVDVSPETGKPQRMEILSKSCILEDGTIDRSRPVHQDIDSYVLRAIKLENLNRRIPKK